MDLPENRLKDLMPDHEKAKWTTVNNHNITEFSEADIRRITKDYSKSIGKGGFGEVYKGVLGDGSIVAVKKYKDQNFKQGFAKEVTVHCQINHKNVVRLLGYCAQDNALTMVTEFISRGNLEQLLHGCDDHLSLATRLRIATECAEALSCMHAMYQPIIHGDIKPANILLDDNFGAKLSDFGISRLLSKDDKAQYTMNAIGSRGYVDPIFLLKGLIDPRNDVYSFGVVILELITRRKVWEDGVITNLIEDFNQAIRKGKQVKQMFDAEITNASNMKIIEKMGKLAAECMKTDLKERPEMKNVVHRLYMLTKACHEKGEERTGIWGVWGTKKSSRDSTVMPKSNSILVNTVMPKSNSILVNKMGSGDIFNRNAGINFERNGGRVLEKINSICIFKEEELIPIIKDSNIVGRRPYGLVYKGWVGGQLVAVKKYHSFDVSEIIDHFANEIIIQSRLVHWNIVRFIGCCLEVDIPMLVYDFGSNGSLHDILHGPNRVPLDIYVRLNIAIGSAEGLAYLHSETASGIRHGNVKPSYILLDDYFLPRILYCRVLRELGNYIRDYSYYTDPVFIKTGLLTTKSDIYSFGVVLLELITREKAYPDLVEKFRDLNNVQEGATRLFDRDIAAPKNLEVLESLAELALECLNDDVDERPTMTDVARRLREMKGCLVGAVGRLLPTTFLL